MKTAIYPGWWQVAVATMIQAVSAASIFTAYSIVAAPLKAEFGPSNLVLMLGITVTTLASGVLSPPLGAALDKFSVRWLMFAASCLVSLGFLLMSFATSMVQVIIIYGAFMAASAVLLGPLAASTLLARWFSRRRGMAIGLAASGSAMGGLVLPPLLQWLIDTYEWREALRIFAAIIFVLTGPAIALLISDRPSDRGLTVENEPPSPAVSVDTAAAVTFSMASAIKDPKFWLIALLLGTVFCGPMAVVSNLIQFVTDKGVEASQGALLLSIISGAGFVGKLLSAALLDRLNLRLVMMAMLVVLALGMFLFLQANTFNLLALAAVFSGLSSGMGSPLWSVTIAKVYGPEQIGKMMGSMTMVIMPFTLCSPPIFGWVYDVTGSYDNAFIGYIVMLLFTLLLMTQLRLEPKSGFKAQAVEISA